MDTTTCYLAGIGMITPVGANTAMTAAAVQAGISGYRESRFFTRETRQPMTLSGVPSEIFDALDVEIDEGDLYGEQFDHIIKMAIIALREAIAGHQFDKPVPLILVMPEDAPDMAYIGDEALITNLTRQPDLPLQQDMVRCVRSGRAAGILGLEMARTLLYGQDVDYVLVGGSDSYWTYERLSVLDEADRVLATDNMDGFAPGEGAGFLLLTRSPEHATVHKDHIIALCQPSSSQEPGHMGSEEPNRGEGLATAFRQTLADYTGAGIHSIYASMNGENFWSKEYGVAYMRNASSWKEGINTEHPADCYGDLGSATGPVLIGLAAENLKRHPGSAAHLVYASSDGPWRAAVRVEKRPRAGN